MIGKKLGRYEILAKLGAGGMGEVYRARDLSLGRDVALKILPEHVREDPDRLGRFSIEARAASALNHPNIVTIYDIGQSDGVPYIAMELVEGQTLRALMTLRPLMTKRALALAAQAAEGLARAHGVGIIHRDLKPENLMVTRDGFVKILDFGLAKLHEPDPILAADAMTEPATRPGVLLGTVGYMSPEQARGRDVDFRSDQFTTGSILYEMATGKRAFEKETAVQTLAAIIESEPEPIQNVNPEVPPPFRWIVERCLMKNPEDRYASTVDLARELRNVHDRLEEVSSGPRSYPPIRLRGGSWLRPATLAAFLGLAAVGVAVWRPAAPPPAPVERGRPEAVAVLPIKNLGGSPADDLLTIAIADAVMTRLAEIPALTVVDRSTVREHRSASDDPVKAARDMGAGFVVTGSVQRVDRRVAVSVRLVRSDSSVAWAQQYEVEPAELFALQRQIAQGLSSALKLRLTAEERQRVERAPTTSADAYADYLQGRAFLERPDIPGNVDRAIEIFQRAVTRDRSFGLAHAGLGEAYWEKYRASKEPDWTTKASNAILEAVRLDPEQAQVRISLAVVYQGTGRTDAAIEELRRVLTLQPRNDFAHRLLGEALALKGLTEDALLELELAVKERPAYWRNHSALAGFLARKGRYEEAIAAARRVTELQPDNSRGFQQLGFAYQQSGRYADAIANYKRALALAPDARAYTNLGKIYYDQGSPAEAVAAWEAGIKLEATPIKHRNLGDAYAKLGDTAKARKAYYDAIALCQQMLRVNPQDSATLSTLAVVEAKVGQRREAERHIEQALALNPKDGETLYRQAVVHALAGRAADAVAALGSALRNGFSRSQAVGDEDLAPIREREDYRQLVGAKS